MKGILLAAMLATLGQGACAREFPYPIKAGLSATVTTRGGEPDRATVRVGNGPEQPLGDFDEEIDQMQAVDIDHDGYQDLALGQSGGGSQVQTRLFLYRPATGGFQEVRHPGGDASPCRGFVNPVFDAERPAFSVGCRYGAASHGFEEYVLNPDGTARATSWTTPAKLTYRFREDGSLDRIEAEEEDSPQEDGGAPAGATSSSSR